MNKNSFVLLIFVCMIGCATKEPLPLPTTYKFDHVIQGDTASIGLVRVFYDAQNTYLLFNREPPKDILILDHAGNAIEYKVLGYQFVIPSVVPSFNVQLAQKNIGVNSEELVRAQSRLEINQRKLSLDETPKIWQLKAGQSLQEALKEWAKESNSTLVWDSTYQYTIEYGLDYHGTFFEALKQLVSTYHQATPPFKIEFFKGNRILLVSSL